MMWNIIGHEWAVNLLSKQIARGRIHHAYLITGPSGVGRRTLALRIAQAINCTQPPRKGNPCLKCHTCTQIFQMAFPDLAIIQAEQRGGTISVVGDADKVLGNNNVIKLLEGTFDASELTGKLNRGGTATILVRKATVKYPAGFSIDNWSM